MKALLLFAVCSIVLFGCGHTDTPVSQKEITANLIKSGAWALENLTIDYIDKTALFQGMTLRFTDGQYSTVNGLPVWSATGTWSFTDDTAKTLLRDDGVVLAIMDLTESKLVIQLQWDKTTFKPGRVTSIKGNHVFTFIKK